MNPASSLDFKEGLARVVHRIRFNKQILLKGEGAG